jgi:hypothetical protein
MALSAGKKAAMRAWWQDAKRRAREASDQWHTEMHRGPARRDGGLKTAMQRRKWHDEKGNIKHNLLVHVFLKACKGSGIYVTDAQAEVLAPRLLDAQGKIEPKNVRFQSKLLELLPPMYINDKEALQKLFHELRCAELNASGREKEREVKSWNATGSSSSSASSSSSVPQDLRVRFQERGTADGASTIPAAIPIQKGPVRAEKTGLRGMFRRKKAATTPDFITDGPLDQVSDPILFPNPGEHDSDEMDISQEPLLG